jgi:hypothetical protein
MEMYWTSFSWGYLKKVNVVLEIEKEARICGFIESSGWLVSADMIVWGFLGTVDYLINGILLGTKTVFGPILWMMVADGMWKWRGSWFEDWRRGRLFLKIVYSCAISRLAWRIAIVEERSREEQLVENRPEQLALKKNLLSTALQAMEWLELKRKKFAGVGL